MSSSTWGSTNLSTNGQNALAAGFVVVSPGCRGRDNTSIALGYYGKAPAAMVDLKAAVRYIRYNTGVIPGNVDMIISSGGSAAAHFPHFSELPATAICILTILIQSALQMRVTTSMPAAAGPPSRILITPICAMSGNMALSNIAGIPSIQPYPEPCKRFLKPIRTVWRLPKEMAQQSSQQTTSMIISSTPI